MKKTRIALCSVLTLALLSSLALTGCKKEKNAQLQDVRLNEVVHSIFYAPQYVALEKGFFEEEGLNVTLDVGQGADKSMTALLSNSADIALLGIEAGFYVYNEGQENYARPFAQLTQRAGNFLVSRVDEPNFEWSDLEGKSVIGGRMGGMPELVLEYVIKENGMTPWVDMEIVNNIQFTSTSSAFVADVGDYSVEFEPVATTLEEQGNGYIVASLGEASGYLPYTVYMATDKYISENPETVQKFTNAIYKGQKWVDENSAEDVAKACLPYFEESNLESLTKIIERYKAQDTWKLDPVMDSDGFELIQEIMEEGGELEKRVPFEGFVITEFAKKSIEEVK